MRRRYEELAGRVDLRVSPDARVGRLRTAEQQKVEILRALARQARLVIMDEPTAALTTHEADRLLEIVRDLRASGTTVVYVSHFLAEVLAVADDVTVLRDGQTRPDRARGRGDPDEPRDLHARAGQRPELPRPGHAARRRGRSSSRSRD